MLVSNDGLSHLQPLEDITAAQLDEMLAVNLRAPFLLAQYAAGSMRERVWPDLVHLRVAASTGGIVGPHHAASKAGLHRQTHFLAFRLAATGVTVNTLAPALVAETRMLPGDPAQLRGRCQAGGLGQPSQVTDLAAAILAKAYLTNQVISLDGGIYPR